MLHYMSDTGIRASVYHSSPYLQFSWSMHPHRDTSRFRTFHSASSLTWTSAAMLVAPVRMEHVEQNGFAIPRKASARGTIHWSQSRDASSFRNPASCVDIPAACDYAKRCATWPQRPGQRPDADLSHLVAEASLSRTRCSGFATAPGTGASVTHQLGRSVGVRGPDLMSQR